jgi:hypothetical protein
MKDKNYVYNKKDCSAFMLLLWYSHDISCMSIVEKVNNHLFRLSDEAVFKYLFKTVKKGKRYLKWDKGIKDKDLLKKENDIIDNMREEYGFSIREAKTFYSLYIKN